MALVLPVLLHEAGLLGEARLRRPTPPLAMGARGRVLAIHLALVARRFWGFQND
jgi:hypothetical protein